MTIVGPGRRELAQFVTDHIFRHKHFDVSLAVVNQKRGADELGHNRARSSPGLDRFLAPRLDLLLGAAVRRLESAPNPSAALSRRQASL